MNRPADDFTKEQLLADFMVVVADAEAKHWTPAIGRRGSDPVPDHPLGGFFYSQQATGF